MLSFLEGKVQAFLHDRNCGIVRELQVVHARHDRWQKNVWIRRWVDSLAHNGQLRTECLETYTYTQPLPSDEASKTTAPAASTTMHHAAKSLPALR